MITRQTRKTLSLLLAFCMVFSMLPTVAFAETAAQAPTITVQPVGATYTQEEAAEPLLVEANVTDGGTLSYQWYSQTMDKNFEGTVIPDETNSTYTPPTGEVDVGTTYYYCVVTNTNNEATTHKTDWVASNTAAVKVVAATAPTVSGFRAERKGANNVEFYFTPSTTGTYGYDISIKGGTAFSPQLYYNINSVEEFAINETIDGISAADILVIYLKIADEHNVESKLYSLEVPAYTVLTDAQPPTIEAQPISATYEQNETAFKLFVSANSTDGGDLSYQWYRNSTNSTVGATEVGTDSYMYTPPTDTVGTIYYYCVVTNTNNDATRNKTATATSQIATVTVEAPSGGTTQIVPAPISGVVSPAVGNVPQITIPDTDQYRASIEWRDANGTFGGTAFAQETAFRLQVTLSAKTGYTFSGLTAADLKGFTVNGIVPYFTNPVSDSLSVIQVEFPATGTVGTDTTKPTVSGYRAERTSAKKTKFYFTPSTNGKFGYNVLKNGAATPTDLVMQYDMEQVIEYTIGSSNASYTAEDILVIYLQIENAAGVKSEIYSLEVPAYTPPTDAQPPSIYEQPKSATYLQNEEVINLFVLANSTDGGRLSYQWYSNATNSTVGGTPVDSTSVNGCTPSTTTVGTTYYYCVVTNTNNEATTNKTAIVTSDVAMVTVNASGGDPTTTITITKHPQNVTVTQGSINGTLTAEAVASNSKPIRYQWRQFIGGIGSDNTQPMLGETSNTFTIPTGLTVGTYQYLCVFNTDGTDYVDSNTAIVTVKPPSGGGSDNGGSGSTGNGGGSSTGGDNITVNMPPATTENPNPPTEVTATVKPTVSGDTVNAAISSNAVNDAISKAQNEARKNGITANGIVVEIKVDTQSTKAESLNTSLSKESVDALIKAGAKELRITSEIADISLNFDTLKEIQKQVGADVNVTVKKVDNSAISEEAQKIVGDRPVYDFSITGTNGKKLTDFGKGKVSVSIPYTLGANENAANVVAYYIDSNGKVQEMPNSVYDPVTQTLSFVTDHFSKFAVGYKNVIVSFTDTTNHWAKDSIEFVVARGILAGTGNGKFAPNDAMTRGMFVTALGRLAEADVSSYKQSSFSDVTAGSYYLGYVEWANKNNIVNGIDSGKFAPDQAISREQMAVIIANYAKVIGFGLPKVHAENTFADHTKIGAWANDAVKSVQMAGIISGKGGNIFDPQGTATRAEVSAVLKRFVELAISIDTAEGWTLNDSGKWMYYENGKPVTGTKNIDGTTYVFDQNGVTADVPKNMRYTTYTVQKGDSFWLIAHKLGCSMSELERLNNKSRFDLIHPGDVLRTPEK